MNEAMQLSTEGLIKPFEGYHKKLPDGGCLAYPDPGTGAEPWTIGWGSTGPDIRPGTTWSLEAAQSRLSAEVAHFAVGALRLSPKLKDAPPRRFAAIISFSLFTSLKCASLHEKQVSKGQKRMHKNNMTYNTANEVTI